MTGRRLEAGSRDQELSHAIVSAIGPTQGNFGNAGRDIIEGPGMNNVKVLL
jgi:hypothetical protein